MRIGVIGYGKWGPNHCRVLDEMGYLTAVLEPSDERRHAASDKHPDAQVYGEPEKFWPEVDAVVIATPIETHQDIITKALLRDKHVLVEKPMCLSAGAASKLAQAAAGKGLILMTGFTFLHDPVVVEIKKLIDTGRVGVVERVHLVRANAKLGEPDVGVIWDTAAHDVAITHWLLGGPPKQVSAMSIDRDAQPVSVVAHLKYPDCVATFLTSWISPDRDRRIEVTGSHGRILWSETHGVAYYEGLAPQPLFVYVDAEEPLKEQAKSFIQSIHRGVADRAGGEFSAQVCRTLSAVSTSAKSMGTPIWR